MATTSTAVAAIEPMFTEPERLALAGYRGLTREACTLELCRLFGAPSCSERGRWLASHWG